MKRPVFIARQSARPSGLLGRVIAGVMAHETLDLNVRAIRLLRLAPSDRVLEIVTDVCSRRFGPFDGEQLRRRQPVYRRVAQRILSLIAD